MKTEKREIKRTKLVQPIYDAVERAGLKVVDSFLEDPIWSYDLRNPPVQEDSTFGNSHPEHEGIYTRHFVLTIPHGKRLLDNQNVNELARVMKKFGGQFRRDDVVQFYNNIGISDDHTTECLGFTNNGSAGGFRVRYYFPDVHVFQKIGQRIERRTIESEYSRGVLESIASELGKPQIVLGQPKEIEKKKSVYIENTFKIFPNEELFLELADKMKKINESESITKLYDNPYRVCMYDQYPDGVCCSIDVEAGKYLFPNWREILKKWNQKPMEEIKFKSSKPSELGERG